LEDTDNQIIEKGAEPPHQLYAQSGYCIWIN
jgi:hypothetical protein